MNELKNRGAEDELIAVADGLKGFPEAAVQTCIVHQFKIESIQIRLNRS